MAQGQGELVSEGLLARVARSADVYPQSLDLVRGLILLIQLEQDAFRKASFLDDRVLTPGVQGAWFRIGQLLELPIAESPQRPLHFIFHTGHVGSTLVSRLLDECAGVLALREPAPLRSLADAFDVLECPESLLSPTQFDALIDLFVRLWRRGFAQTRSVIVKATSHAGRMAVPLLSRTATARAIYLNVRAETYLTTLLAGDNSLIDLRGHAVGRMRRLQVRCTEPLAPLHSMSSGELAAMSWLSETWSQQQAIEQLGSRVRAVDFESFLGAICEQMALILTHFDLSFGESDISRLAHSEVLTQYSKAPDNEYSPRLRAEILADSRRHNMAEIRRGRAWLESLAARNVHVAALVSGGGI